MMERSSPTFNTSGKLIRYPVTQEQIDDILKTELQGVIFPVRPVYNFRIRDNGRVVADMYRWGELKQIKAIEIGKQDSQSRRFLTDTLLHEYYEAEILKRQHSDEFFSNLHRAGDDERHKWIDAQITKYFSGWSDNNELE